MDHEKHLFNNRWPHSYYGATIKNHFFTFLRLRGRISRKVETFCATTRAQIKDFVFLVNLVSDFPYVAAKFLEKFISKEVLWPKIFATKLDHPAFYYYKVKLFENFH